jgi:DNA-binding NarL/FixJ family response regulator
MIRVAVVDRHPTVRAGLDAILGAQPDMVAVGGAAGGRELWPLLHRVRPAVVVLDADPLGGALELCLQMKAGLARPRVVLHASEVRTAAIVPARLAGADGIVDKAADARELLHAIRTAAGGESALPRITPRLQTDAAMRLAPQDRAIFAMRLAGTSAVDIAATMRLDAEALEARTAAILATLSRPELVVVGEHPAPVAAVQR